MNKKIKDIIFREDLYPRFEPNQSLIQKYSDSIEYLPPIKVNQNNILIDGFHRWKAYQLVGHESIPVEIINITSEKEVKKLAYQLNSNHGLQLTNDEKRKYAQEMYGEITVKELSNLLGVSEKTINRWTITQAENAKEERDRKIIELYLKAENTQKKIADILGIHENSVANIIDSHKNRHLSNFMDTFTPYIYNIWNLQKQDNARGHFGAFPEAFMKNLLYYHTEPLDIIFDPFAGSGTTVDICKRMFRRYYCSDKIVIPGRENDIKEHDILNGFPNNLPKPDLVFLDPPYWKQAEGKYSNDSNDLGNMNLDDFYNAINKLLKDLSDWKINKIAIVIAPTQYPNNMIFEDHIFKFNKILTKYNIEMRYMMPYSTQQYNGNMVDNAKKNKICLNVIRDLIIWRLNE